jgi:hypothetical protein
MGREYRNMACASIATMPAVVADSPPPPDPLLGEPLVAFVESGLSITVASRGERLVPSIAKAAGLRVAADRRSVSVLVFADAAEAVLRDIAHCAQVAVCLTRPSTNQTVQLKGRDARAQLATPQDVAAARTSIDGLIDDLLTLGFSRSMLEPFFWHDPADLLAVHFTPDGAFAQTPGPQAGRRLEPGDVR